MKTNLFIESVEPGAVAPADAPRSMEGRRALLDVGDVGRLLRVPEQCRSEMKGLDGDFELHMAEGDEPHDCMGRIDGEEFGMSTASAHVPGCALERACLDVSRTRA